MFFGGWLYPDVPSTGIADTEVAFDRDDDEDEFDCAAMGTDVAQATSAPAKI
jgi:hypothetical protein